jgi:hypothetical protein
MTRTDQTTMSRGDKVSLIAFCIAGVLIVGFVTVHGILRIIQLARGVDVPVLVEFIDLPVSTATDAGQIALNVDRAILTAPELPPIATVPGIIGVVVQILTIAVVVGCLILLSGSILRGRVFSRRNTALAMTAGIAGMFGFATSRFFDNMLANATVNVVTDNALDNAVLTVEPFVFILAAFVIATIGTVFVVGDRLQRETEGLV